MWGLIVSLLLVQFVAGGFFSSAIKVLFGVYGKELFVALFCLFLLACIYFISTSLFNIGFFKQWFIGQLIFNLIIESHSHYIAKKHHFEILVNKTANKYK